MIAKLPTVRETLPIAGLARILCENAPDHWGDDSFDRPGDIDWLRRTRANS
jgi:hypothetical protein